jgi:VWFA-related protein
MSRAAAVVVPLLVLASAFATARRQDQKPVFRAHTDLVSVDVSVTRARRPLTGLTAKDFVLTDNGVEQVVEAITVEALPIDVSLVVDLSGSTASTLERVKADITRMAGMLRPTDRVRLIRFADDVRQIVPMQPATEPLPLDDLKPGQSTSLNDALFVALARPPELNRRHLVVVFTDAEDTWSAIENSSVPVIASRADAVLHVVLSTYDRTTDPSVMTTRQALRQAADVTGGDVRYLRDAVGAFRQVLDEFRTSYVLRYTPRGVKREGWHELTVTVTRPGTFTVRARRGYFGG